MSPPVAFYLNCGELCFGRPIIKGVQREKKGGGENLCFGSWIFLFIDFRSLGTAKEVTLGLFLSFFVVLSNQPMSHNVSKLFGASKFNVRQWKLS
jgi:hypothetical protein